MKFISIVGSIISFILGFLCLGLSLKFLLFTIIYIILLKISIKDWKTHTINIGTLIILSMQVIPSLFIFNEITITDRLIGAAIAGIPFLLICLLSKGMGIGDVILIIIGGLILGYKLIIPATLISLFTGVILGIVIKIRTKKQNIALGPFLSFGIITTILIWW